MSEEEFIQLKWNTHQSTFIENLSGLRDKQIFTDVTLSCGDQFYPAHQLVLSTCSTFFAHALGVVKSHSPVLLLHGIEQSTLEELLMFMYDGQVTISRSCLPDLLKAAQWLGVKGLESTVDNLGSMCEPDHTATQIASNQFPQVWNQLLSLIAKNRQGSGISDAMFKLLKELANKSIEQGNSLNNKTVSHVSSLNPDLDCEDNSFEFELDTNEADGVFKDDQCMESKPFLPENVSLPEHFLDMQCSSKEEHNSENSFEGWNDVTCSSKIETIKKRKRKIKEIEVLQEYVSCEEPGNKVGNENVKCDDQAKGKRSLHCKHCKHSFNGRSGLMKHLRIYHNSQSKICILCNKVYITERSFKLHMKLHDSGYLFSCNKCGFKSNNKSSLMKHYNSHANKSTQEELSQSSHMKYEIIEEGSPQMDQSERSPQTDRSERSPQTDRSERPPQIDRSERPLQIDRSERPPQIDRSERPPQIDRSERPPQIDRSERPPQIDRSEGPPQIDRSEGPPQIDRSEGPPQIDRSEGPPQIDRSEGPPQIDRSEGPPQIDRSEGPPQIDRSEGPPQIDRSEGPPQIDRPEGPPQIDRPEGPPQIDRPEGLPQIDRPEGPPQIDLSERLPQIDQSETSKLKCSTCLKTFKNRKIFDKHEVSSCKGVFESKVMYSCPLCMAGFTRKCSLNDHMCIHTGNYPFCCPHCSYRCTRNSSLQMHFKKKHSNL